MKLHNLRKVKASGYTTWGCMWEQGRCGQDTEYVCTNEWGEQIPMQSRITAYWPDGSVKWTAHTADSALLGENIEVLPGKPVTSVEGISIEEDGQKIVLYNGLFAFHIPKSGAYLFTDLKKGDIIVLTGELRMW